MELFSALDNALSQKAQETLTEFAAVKKADIQLQTPLGNRQAQIGINVIGAFAESQSSAFGWQVRAFGGKDNIGGANAGVFFRRLENEWLYGINVFADYESGDYGEFFRYGIGGELQNPFSALAVNYYLPITDDKRQGANVAFSQKGYDANLRINIPRLDYLKLRGDYYLFDGKYGGEDDKGFRYGLELQPINDLRIGVFYDDGGEKFGGDIAYTYNFGNRQLSQKRESTADFSPDLFSPVLREYSQRIISTTTLQVVEVPTLTLFTTTTIPARVQRTTLGLGFITVSMPITIATATITDFMTMAGMTTLMEIPTMQMAQAASALFTMRIDNDNTGTSYDIAVATMKFLITIPAFAEQPIVLTIQQNFWCGFMCRPFTVISGSDSSRIGFLIQLASATDMYTISVVENSRDFVRNVGAAETRTLTTEMTAADIITETMMTLSAATITRMTNTLMPTLTTTMTISAMMITMPTLTLYQIITTGIPTTNIGAAIDNSPLPPSFPPSSFPPFPQVPKLALAAPVILARRAGIQHNRIAIIQKPRRQYAQ